MLFDYLNFHLRGRQTKKEKAVGSRRMYLITNTHTDMDQ